MSERLIN